MRQKRAKTYKRVMALYQTAFNFRQPYQLLASNDFLLEAITKDVDILKQLSTCVQGLIKPMITQCCIEALYKLGKDQERVVSLAKGFERRRCNHRTAIDPAECLTEMIGTTNKHRYVLCTASTRLLTSLSPVPGLPIIHFNPRGVLVLSPPSSATLRAKHISEEARRVEGSKILEGIKDGDNVLGGGQSRGNGSEAGRKGMRRAKNPNPLSVKKKKVKIVSRIDGKGKKRARDEEGETVGDGDKGQERNVVPIEGVDSSENVKGSGLNIEQNDNEADNGADTGDTGGRRRKKRKRGRGKGVVAAAIAEIKGEQRTATGDDGSDQV